MTPELLALLGVLASITLTSAAYGGLTGRLTPEVGIVAAATAVILWGSFAYAALAVDVGVDESTGEIVTTSYEPLAMLAAIAALASVVILGKATIEVFAP